MFNPALLKKKSGLPTLPPGYAFLYLNGQPLIVNGLYIIIQGS